MNVLNAGGRENTNASPKFTQQEFTILKLACEFMSNQAIANQLFICEETVKTHRKNIRKKVGISGKTAMTQFLMTFKRSLE
jgi:DNA-binding NarL/FixJ family response regulator